MKHIQPVTAPKAAQDVNFASVTSVVAALYFIIAYVFGK
jgi:hypothetical protein